MYHKKEIERGGVNQTSVGIGLNNITNKESIKKFQPIILSSQGFLFKLTFKLSVETYHVMNSDAWWDILGGHGGVAVLSQYSSENALSCVSC